MKTIEERNQRCLDRHWTVEIAVKVADRAIRNGSDGTVEEIDWLTAQVAQKFNAKVLGRISSELLRKDFEG